MNLLANPGFDHALAGSPSGWTCHGPGQGREWLPGAGREGGACVVLRGVVGRMEWRSDPVPVPSGQRLALSWWTRIEGREPWHWSYLVNFVGVVVRYLDGKGQPVAEQAYRLRCIRTEGWTRAWLHLDAPRPARAASMAFIWDAPFETDGAVWLDDVALCPLVPQELPAGYGRLACRVVDAASGHPLRARAWVRDAQGQAYQPEFCFDYPHAGGAFHVPEVGEWELAVPAGPTSVSVTRGFEYRPWRGQVEVTAGKTTQLTVPLDRLVDLPAQGWLGGDHHAHLFFHGHTRHPQMTPALAMQVAQGEGLNYLPLQSEMTEVLAGFAEHRVAAAPGFIGEYGLEVVSDFWGHMCTLNLHHEPELGFPMRQVLYPMNTDVFRQIVPDGSALIYPHPLNEAHEDQVIATMGDPGRMLLARELPITLAAGFACGYDLLGEDDPEGLAAKVAEYYRLLDVGFRVAATAGTDYYVDQGHGFPGAVRTYVQAGRLDFGAIAAAYARGAAFCTNGPLVLLTVQGCSPGEQVELAEDRELEVRIQAWSAWGLTEAELVVEGEVAARFPAQGDHLEVAARLPARSCWVAARVSGPAAPEVDSRFLPASLLPQRGQYAHTSPVWVELAGRPRRPRRENVEHFLEWVAAVRHAYQGNRDRLLPQAVELTGLSAGELARMIEDRLDQAEAYYRGLLGQAI